MSLIAVDNPGNDLYGLLTKGLDTWGQVATARINAPQPVVYSRAPVPDSANYPVGVPALSSVGQATAAGAAWLPIALIAGLALVAVLVLKR